MTKPNLKIPHVALLYYLENKDKDWDIFDFLDVHNAPGELHSWLYETGDVIAHQFAFSTLVALGPDAVEVYEDLYTVKVKITGQLLAWTQEEFLFVSPDLIPSTWRTSFTLKELGDCGFHASPLLEFVKVGDT